MVTGVVSIGHVYDNDIFRVTAVQFVPLHTPSSDRLVVDARLIEVLPTPV